MKYKHHAPPLVAEGLPASVELHIRPTSLAGKRTLLDASFARQGARLKEFEGARALIPSPEFRLLHNFFHTQHQDGKDYRFGRVNIRGLLDWIKLRNMFDSDVAWPSLIERVRHYKLHRSFSAYLITTQEFFNQSPPGSLRLNQSAKIHVQRQKLFLKYPVLARLINLVLYSTQGIWHIFSPTILRKEYGDASMLTWAGLRMTKFKSQEWRSKKLKDILRIVR